MKLNKLIACTLSAIVAVGCFAGCGGPSSSGGGDSSKSIFNVGASDTGYGALWLENSAKAFEEKYADVVFEEGKKGVEIVIDKRVEEFTGENLRLTMAGNPNAIYCVGASGYEILAQSDLLVDITDVINEDIYDDKGNLVESNATTSIMDTMRDEFVGLHEVNGKYYGIPLMTYSNSIIYDADLFNEKGYYFFANGNMGAKQADIDAGTNIGTGPDGVVGTPDDGMPVTYSDFVRLLEKMDSDDVIPFTFAGGTGYQINFAYNAIFANYQGYDDYMLNWSFDGTDSKGNVITESNLDPLINQEGRKAALQFFHDIIRNNYYRDAARTEAHTTALFKYIDSVNEYGTDKRVAMCFEGGYWENEARFYFDEAAAIDPDMGYGKRDFRMLPIPNFTDTTGIAAQTNTSEKEVIVTKGAESYIALAKDFKAENKEAQKEIAIEFLKFIQSREQLSNFTRDTGACFRSYNFEPTAEELATWTKFGQNVYSYVKNGSKFATSNITNSQKRKNIYATYEFAWDFSCQEGQTNAIMFFYLNGSQTVETAFTSLKNKLNTYKNK